MAGKLSFWDKVVNGLVVFFLFTMMIIFLAGLSYGLIYGTPQVSEKHSAEYTAPVGKVFYRP